MLVDESGRLLGYFVCIVDFCGWNGDENGQEY